MLNIKIPSKRLLSQNAPASFGDTDLEKEAILKKLQEKVWFKAGQTVSPHSEHERKIWGSSCVVENVATTLKQLGTSTKWPEDNNPMIVQVYSHKQNCSFYCTVCFLVPCVETCPC